MSPSLMNTATTGSIVRAADTNIGVAASLLKKTMNADKNLVDTLLPATPAVTTGRLDIRA